uniref:DUF19 domain-containing protein n=1 Tax=Parastrongyloides trichosuri TaxID=131310 RepID=A0A0N4ZIH2_PARTI
MGEKTTHEFCPHIYNEQIQNCVLPVSQYAKILHQQNGDGKSTTGFDQAISIPKVGKDVFQELCRLIRSFDSCVLELREQCPKHITINLIDASYGYLCNEGYNTFLNSAECLMELDLEPGIKKCHDETLNDIENVNGMSEITLHSKLDRMCGALNYFSSCVKNPIKEKCGNEAWLVIHQVLKDTTKTLMPGCLFNGNHHHHTKKVHIHENKDRHHVEFNAHGNKIDDKEDNIDKDESQTFDNDIKVDTFVEKINARVQDRMDVVTIKTYNPSPFENDDNIKMNHEKYQREEHFHTRSKNFSDNNKINIMLKLLTIILYLYKIYQI